MEKIKDLFKQLRQEAIVSLLALPFELEIEPTNVVIDFGIERDGVQSYGGYTIVKIGEGGKIWNDKGNEFSIGHIHSTEDLIELREATFSAAVKELEKHDLNEDGIEIREEDERPNTKE